MGYREEFNAATVDSSRQNAANNIGLKAYVDGQRSDANSQYATALNNAKTISIYIGPYHPNIRDLNNKTYWNNWTQKKVNGIIDVNKFNNYWLNPDSLTFSVLIKNKFVSVGIDTFLQNFSKNISNSNTESVLDMLDTGIELTRVGKDLMQSSTSVKDYQGSTYIPKFQNVQAWEGVEPIEFKIPTISFRFGQYGLYNAFEEVVLPIIALMSSFFPTKEKEDGSTNRWIGPLPSPTVSFLSVLKTLKGEIPNILDNFISDLKNGAGKAGTAIEDAVTGNDSGSDNSESSSILQKVLNNGGGDVLDTAIKFKDNLYSAFDKANQELLEKTQNKLAYFRLSKAIVGPIYVREITPDFDFSNVDQNGYPTKGSIQFSATTTPLLATHDSLDIFGILNDQDPFFKTGLSDIV